MVGSSITPSDLENLLAQFLIPDSGVLAQATEAMKRVLENSSSIDLLVHCIQTCPREELRQLAAILLRKKITAHWIRLGEPAQENIKRVLLETLQTDQSHPVRHAVSSVVAMLARFALPTWPELLQFLPYAAQSNEEAQRLVAFGLFEELAEVLGDVLREHLTSLLQLFGMGLQDASPRVRMAALSCARSFVIFLEQEAHAAVFRGLMPKILEILARAVEEQDEDTAAIGFELLEDAVEGPSGVLKGIVPDVLRFALFVATNVNFDLSLRKQALNFVIWLSQYKPKTVKKQNLLSPILEVVCHLIAEPVAQRGEEEDAPPMYKTASQTLDQLAEDLNGELIVSEAMRHVAQFVQLDSFEHRRAAVLIIAVMAEGCSDYMGDNIPQFLPYIQQAFRDTNPEVRAVACFAIGQFAEHLQPDIIQYHADVIPLLSQLLQDPLEDVKERSCYALEEFCSELGDSITPYLEYLVAQLLDLLRTAQCVDLQISIITALAAAASGAKQNFAPFYEATLSMLLQLISITDTRLWQLRARATDCLGLVACAVGRAMFEPAAHSVFDLVYGGLRDIDSEELRENSYAFFGSMATMYEKDFAPHLETLMPYLIASLETEEGAELRKDTAGEIDLGDDEDEDEDEEIWVSDAFIDEKACAASCIGTIAKSVGHHFLPYVSRSLHDLLRMAMFHGDVRTEAVVALSHVAIACYDTIPPPPPWEPGLPARVPLRPATIDVLRAVLTMLLDRMRRDEDKEVCARCCQGVSEILRTIGPACLELMPVAISGVNLRPTDRKTLLEILVNVSSLLLRKKVRCQRVRQEDEDDEEHELLIDHVTDCIIAAAKALGASFQTHLAQLFPHILAYSDASLPVWDRAMAIGSFAELAKGLGDAYAPFVEASMRAAYTGLSGESPAVRRNSAFCTGILCALGSVDLSSHFLTLLGALRPLFEATEDAATRDNAAGAVSRMIIRNAAVIPLDEVLPVLLTALPLKDDMEENESVYNALFHLFSQYPDMIMKHIPRILVIFAEALEDERVSDGGIKTQMGVILKQLVQQCPDILQTIAQLPEGQQRRLIEASRQQ